jgi:hypothetical protein
MKVKGRWKGNYMGSGQMPEALIFEIEIWTQDHLKNSTIIKNR